MVQLAGANWRGKEAQLRRCRIILGALKYCRGTKKSHQCHTCILQYSTFASGRPQVRKWGCQTCILPRAPSNLVMPLSVWRLVLSRNPSTHLCCKTMIQTNCGLTNCTGNSPETGFSFSFWRLVKSWVSNKLSTLHSYFYCCLFPFKVVIRHFKE